MDPCWTLPCRSLRNMIFSAMKSWGNIIHISWFTDTLYPMFCPWGYGRGFYFRSLSPRKCGCDFRCVDLKPTGVIHRLSVGININREWMTRDFVDLVNIGSGKRLLLSRKKCYLNWCWPRFLMPYCATKPQSVDISLVISQWQYR